MLRLVLGLGPAEVGFGSGTETTSRRQTQTISNNNYIGPVLREAPLASFPSGSLAVCKRQFKMDPRRPGNKARHLCMSSIGKH